MPDDEVRTDEIGEEDEWGWTPDGEDAPASETEGEGSAADGRKRRRTILLTVVALLIAAGLGYWLTFHRAVPAEPEAPVVEPAPEPVAVEEPVVELPPLDASDPFLRSLLAALTEHPDALAWLLGDDLARHIAVAVDNVADGLSPRPVLSGLGPSDPFRATGEGEEFHVDPASFARYNSVAAAIAEGDVPGLVRVIRESLPILDAAYAELGRPDRTFAEALLMALDQLVAVPVPEMPVLLDEQILRYEHRDPALEGLDDASKHLVRFGPENQAKAQEAFRRLAAGLRAGGSPF